MLAAQQRLESQAPLVIGRPLVQSIPTLGATCPYVRNIIILIHPFAASRSNQGDRLDVDEAEANRAVSTGVEK